jgi:hypothetical protein
MLTMAISRNGQNKLSFDEFTKPPDQIELYATLTAAPGSILMRTGGVWLTQWAVVIAVAASLPCLGWATGATPIDSERQPVMGFPAGGPATAPSY